MKPKILIIDHYDSFTYNLVQLAEQAGGEVQVAQYNDLLLKKAENFDGILLSPGPGLPIDYPKSLELIDQLKGFKPILGVCMGLQLIVTYFGGKIYNLPEVQHGKRALIYEVNQSKLFNQMEFPFHVGLYHSWAAEKDNFGKGLMITSALQNGIIMSLEHHRYNIQAVQFHPESYMTENGLQMILNWIDNL